MPPRNSTREDVHALLDQGMSRSNIAKHLGISRQAVHVHVTNLKRAEALGPDVVARLGNQGVTPDNLHAVHSGWLKSMANTDEAASGESVYFYLGKAPEEASDHLQSLMDDTLDTIRDHAIRYPASKRRLDKERNLLIVDPADVHIGKLCVRAETGVVYNRDIAVRRMLDGADALLQRALAHGVSEIILVIGNDILHADRWDGTTTAGTKQDTHGLWHEWFKDARDAYVRLIERLADVARVHLVFCPSNHDWQSGWYLAQTLGAWFSKHPGVTCGVDDSYLSPSHRKYFVYEQGLYGFTHGDGAKENDLPNLMQVEARAHWSATKHSYWYTHHLHHKRRTRAGVKHEMLEQDKIGVTVIASSAETMGGGTEIEVVRSPSPPDGWHHRNGYVNAQAVECYLHGPDGAQFARFTEFF